MNPYRHLERLRAMRKAKVERKTRETDIKIEFNLDGRGKYSIKTGLAFFEHLLSSLSRHGSFDLKINARGDNEHHLVEDIAICLGEALKDALGDKKGIARFGQAIIPMDDVLMLVAVDIGGRSYCSSDLGLRTKKIEGLSAEMIPHFIETLAAEAKMNIHAKRLGGKNDHHKAEALFKALGVALSEATRVTSTGIPSTKGKL